MIPDPGEDRSKAKLKALVVDDFEPFRKLVCATLTEIGVEVVGEATDGLEAFYMFGKLKPNLVVLDLNLPRLSGIEIAKIIRITQSDCGILLCTVVIDGDVMDEAFRCGVDAYIVKADFLKEVRPAIKAVLQNRRYASQTILRAIKE